VLNNDTRTMLVEVDLPNHDGTLLPGMYAQVSLQVATLAGLPMVPDDAVLFENDNSYVPIVLNNHLKLAEVKLGYDDGVNVQILRGVADPDLAALKTGRPLAMAKRCGRSSLPQRTPDLSADIDDISDDNVQRSMLASDRDRNRRGALWALEDAAARALWRRHASTRRKPV
jgi:hypothetical protein